MCGADAPTFGIIKVAFEDFHALSGLQPDIQNVRFSLLRVSNDDKVVLRSILPIPEGAVPVKDLEIP